jgi:hypothetical protein
MIYLELNCLKGQECQRVLQESVEAVCKNMDKGHYTWEDVKGPREGWKKFGILVNGDRRIIDN